MISPKAVVVVLSILLGVCLGATIDDVDRVLQEIAQQRFQPQGTGDSFDFDQFLDHSALFKEFVVDYGKEYNSDEHILRRFEIFQENLKEIKLLQESELGTAEYGVNQFADLTGEEFTFGLSPLNIESINETSGLSDFQTSPSYQDSLSIEKRVNYIEKGKVLEKVHHQHMCGSCWAHATAATLEAAYAIKHNKLVELSTQQLVDCDFYNDGCCGGWPHRAFQWIHYVGGLEEEKDYKQGLYEGKCRFDQKKARVDLEKSYIISSPLPQSNVEMFAKFLSNVGTLAATLNAKGLKFYKGGIMNQPNVLCNKNPQRLNHAVLNIGYDEEVINGETYPYWIIKNSWGPNWGEKGYMRILKGSNCCGVEWAAFGVVAK